MKKLISLLCVFALLAALAVPASAAVGFELNARAEMAGDTAIVTCGPELHSFEGENYSTREHFFLSGVCGLWEAGDITLCLSRISVVDYTMKKYTDIPAFTNSRSVLELDKPAAAVALQFILYNGGKEELIASDAGILFCAKDGQPILPDLHLSLAPQLKELHPGSMCVLAVNFASYEFDAKNLNSFEILLPAPVSADLTPVSAPLRIRVELRHES